MISINRQLIVKRGMTFYRRFVFSAHRQNKNIIQNQILSVESTYDSTFKILYNSSLPNKEWDNFLASEAARWARGCRFEHKNGQGENLAFNSNFMSDKEHIKSALNAWNDERKDYTYNTLSCRGVCSHYTNVSMTIYTLILRFRI